jgi:hypothetical protein
VPSDAATLRQMEGDRMQTKMLGAKRRIGATYRALRGASARDVGADATVAEDVFCREPPSAKTAVDIFAGQWSSDLPSPNAGLTGGGAQLFEDGRISFADEQFGGVQGMRVIELGPLEGGHSYMLDRMGAADIVAIEANQRAFLRCLVAKELLGMPSAHFLCGDFVPYLRQAASEGRRWDLCLAVGVLYHQPDPVSLLEVATAVSDRLLLWTHYFDAEALQRNPAIAASFSTPEQVETGGYRHVLYRHDYGPAVGWSGFCGGLNTWTSWMTRDGILGALDHFGFDVIATAFDDRDHPNGPAFCLVAEQR